MSDINDLQNYFNTEKEKLDIAEADFKATKEVVVEKTRTRWVSDWVGSPSYTSAYYSSDGEVIEETYSEQETYPDTERNIRGRQDLERIYNTSEWYSLRCRAGDLLKKADLADTYDRWIRELKSNMSQKNVSKVQKSRAELDLKEMYRFCIDGRYELAKKATGGRDSDILRILPWFTGHINDGLDLISDNEDNKFELAVEYTKNKDPKLRILGLFKLALLGDAECYQPLAEHFLELLGEDHRFFFNRNLKLNLDHYRGIADTLCAINPSKAKQLLTAKFTEALENMPDEKWDQVIRSLWKQYGNDSDIVDLALKFGAKDPRRAYFIGIESIKEHLREISCKRVRKTDKEYSTILYAIEMLGSRGRFSAERRECLEVLTDLLSHNEKSIAIEAAMKIGGCIRSPGGINARYITETKRASIDNLMTLYHDFKKTSGEDADAFVEKVGVLKGMGTIKDNRIREYLKDVCKRRSSSHVRTQAKKELHPIRYALFGL